MLTYMCTQNTGCCKWFTAVYTFIRSFTTVYLKSKQRNTNSYVFHRCVPESKQRNTHLYGLSPRCTWIKATKIHIYTVFHHSVPESKQRKYTFIRSFTAVYLNQSKENTHCYGLSPLCTWIKAKKHTFMWSFTARYPNENKEIHIYAVCHHCVPKQIPLGFDVV